MQNVTIVVLLVVPALVLLGSLNQNAYAHSTTGQFEDLCFIDSLNTGTSHSLSIDPASPVAGDNVRITSTDSNSQTVRHVVFKDGVRITINQSSFNNNEAKFDLLNVFDGEYEVWSCNGSTIGSTGEFFTNHIDGPLTFTVVGFPDSDGDGVPIPDDCDDLDRNNFPGNTETPGDQQDNNCNDLIDEFVIEDDPAFNELSDRVDQFEDPLGREHVKRSNSMVFEPQGTGMVQVTCDPDEYLLQGSEFANYNPPPDRIPAVGVQFDGLSDDALAGNAKFFGKVIGIKATVFDNNEFEVPTAIELSIVCERLLPPFEIGGMAVSLEPVALLLAYATVNAEWFVPAAIGTIGVGIYLVKRRF